MPSSQAAANLTHVPDAAEGFITLAKSQEEEEEENPREQHGVTSRGWAVVARMAVDNADKMELRKVGSGDTKGKESRVDAKVLFP